MSSGTPACDWRAGGLPGIGDTGPSRIRHVEGDVCETVEGLRDENGLVVVVLGAGDGGKGFFFVRPSKEKFANMARCCVRRGLGERW